jgi:hypothetical protein
MLITLRGSRGRALKANRSLSNSVIELKVDCPRIQIYLHVSLIRFTDQYRPYASGSIYPLGTDQKLPDTWMGQSICPDREHIISFLRLIIFVVGLISPFGR